jgi:large repetitive protein
VAESSHTYTAKATDSAGNTSAASNARTVSIDTTTPETAIDSGPLGTVTSTSATFEFSSTEMGSSFECKLDAGAAFESYSSPKSYTNLSGGTRTFDVRATDGAGNVDVTPLPATSLWRYLPHRRKQLPTETGRCI